MFLPLFAGLVCWAGPDEALEVQRQVPDLEQRDVAGFPRGPYLNHFYRRHRAAWGQQSAIHVAHGAAHDVANRTPPAQHGEADRRFDERMTRLVHRAPKNGPVMETYGPAVSQWAWPLYRTIDWTHVLHEQTYDILADADIDWEDKKAWTDRAVREYLERQADARSPAPLDVTMRRAGVMMKPYFGYFRNRFPASAQFFFAAHWWHPAVYEAMMVSGNGRAQDDAVTAIGELLEGTVLGDRPKRMILSRELMPRYARMSPEAANIFDNLHMLHGIAYDLMAYPHWSVREKKRELYRVLDAMQYRPGDEQLARMFRAPEPTLDPRRYEPWMKGVDGEMTRIMLEMVDEMMPMMMPGLDAEGRARVIAQTRKKLAPGMEPGEIDGSLADALRHIVPEMKRMASISEPGGSAPLMMQAMLTGWYEKHGHMAGAPEHTMATDPGSTR